MLPLLLFARLWVSVGTPGTFSPGSCPAAAGLLGSLCARAGAGLAMHRAETRNCRSGFTPQTISGKGMNHPSVVSAFSPPYFFWGCFHLPPYRLSSDNEI